MKSILEDDAEEYKTREDFARSFVPAFKQALKMAERKMAGESLGNDFEQHIQQLKAEAEKMRTGN